MACASPYFPCSIARRARIAAAAGSAAPRARAMASASARLPCAIAAAAARGKSAGAEVWDDGRSGRAAEPASPKHTTRRMTTRGRIATDDGRCVRKPRMGFLPNYKHGIDAGRRLTRTTRTAEYADHAESEHGAPREEERRDEPLRHGGRGDERNDRAARQDRGEREEQREDRGGDPPHRQDAARQERRNDIDDDEDGGREPDAAVDRPHHHEREYQRRRVQRIERHGLDRPQQPETLDAIQPAPDRRQAVERSPPRLVQA